MVVVLCISICFSITWNELFFQLLYLFAEQFQLVLPDLWFFMGSLVYHRRDIQGYQKMHVLLLL